MAFTFIEMVIALLVLGIMAALATPRYNESLSHFRADAAARRIAADLALAQQQAILRSATQTVEFFPAGAGGSNSYRISGVKHLNQPLTDYVVVLSSYPYQATLVSADFNQATTVTFNQFGVPSSGGTLVVRAGNHTRQIRLAQETGRITVQ